jgi:hypothetical protein
MSRSDQLPFKRLNALIVVVAFARPAVLTTAAGQDEMRARAGDGARSVPPDSCICGISALSPGAGSDRWPLAQAVTLVRRAEVPTHMSWGGPSGETAPSRRVCRVKVRAVWRFARRRRGDVWRELRGAAAPQAGSGGLVRRQSLRRLWVAAISRHSARQARNPRRWKRSVRRRIFVCANTGSMICARRR